VGEARLERARERYGSADYKAATGVMRGVFVTTVGEEYGEAMRAVSCPTVLVWGADDADVPVEVARRAAAELGGAELRILPGVGHLTPTEAPEALRDAVLGLKP
jgi:pimeloyl-ACP methyl ester carboxylesterase